MPRTPWSHRWNVLGLTLLSQVLVLGIQTSSFAFWIVPWLGEFQAPRSELMLIITVSVLGVAIVSPFAGLALDKLSMRLLFVSGATLFAATLFLVSLAHSHWIIMFLYGVTLPIGLVLCGQIGSQTLITRWFKTNRGFALGISALGISLGGVMLPLIVTALLPEYGWRATFQILAAATFLLLVPSAMIVLRKNPDEESDAQPSQTDAILRKWTTHALFCNRDFWIIALGFGALLTAYIPSMYSLGAYAKDLGITQKNAALAASLGAVSLSFGKVIFGRLTDIVEHHHMYWISSGFTAGGIIVVSSANSFTSLLVGLLLTNLAIGSYVPLLTSIVVSRFGATALGQVMGLAVFFIQLSAVSPFLVALIRDSTGDYRLAFLVMLIPLLPAAIAMRWLSRHSLTGFI